MDFCIHPCTEKLPWARFKAHVFEIKFKWSVDYLLREKNRRTQRKKKINVCFWELPTFPSPNLIFCPKREVSVNVRFGEGWVGSFSETYIDPKNFLREQKREPTTYVAGSGIRTRATIVGGERSHHYATPASFRKQCALYFKRCFFFHYQGTIKHSSTGQCLDRGSEGSQYAVMNPCDGRETQRWVFSKYKEA